MSEKVTAEQGLRPVPDRLADALSAAAADFMRRAEVEPAAAETRLAREVLALTVHAINLWALTRDALDDAHWPSVLTSRPRGRPPWGDLPPHLTRAGKAQYRMWSESIRAEHQRTMDAPDED